MLERADLWDAMPAALEASAVPTAVVVSGLVEWVNPSCARLLGRRQEHLTGRRVEDFLFAEEAYHLMAETAASTTGCGDLSQGVHRIARPGGDIRWVCATVTPMASPAPLDASLVQLTDMTTERETQQELRHLATHDPLTGLPNRALFLEHLEHALRRRERVPGKHLAVLLVDIDRFRHINDTYGHGTGERLLAAAGERLCESVRPQDVVARLAGDEFAVLLEGIPDAEALDAAATRCLAAIRRPYEILGERLSVTASIGIASTAGPATPDHDLVAVANAALREAKDNGRGRVEHLTPSRASHGPRTPIERQLGGALDRDELEVHYQPIIDLDSGEVAAGEALLRWRHPELGLLPAGRFISIAEEGGMMTRIGDWVTDVVCADLRSWDDAGRSVEHVYVNVAAQQIHDEFVEHVSETLVRHGVAATRLRLEITETELMSRARSLEQLDALHRLGCSLVVDDFGTGYSSLSRLIDLPIDVVKIDRSFISGVGVDPRPTAVVSAALLLAHDLRQGVVAEGVETEDQRRWLCDAGCAFAQGFGIAMPVPAAEFWETRTTELLA